MHGTVVMLMALSGLGCHYKNADVTYAPSCYSSVSDSCYSGCYSAGYTSIVEPSCYSSCYSSGYGGYQASSPPRASRRVCHGALPDWR